MEGNINLNSSSSTSNMLIPVENIKIEPFDPDPYDFLQTNMEIEPQSILPDLDQTETDHPYSIETISPYKLIVPKTEPTESQSNIPKQPTTKELSKIQPTTKELPKIQPTTKEIVSNLRLATKQIVQNIQSTTKGLVRTIEPGTIKFVHIQPKLLRPQPTAKELLQIASGTRALLQSSSVARKLPQSQPVARLTLQSPPGVKESLQSQARVVLQSQPVTRELLQSQPMQKEQSVSEKGNITSSSLPFNAVRTYSKESIKTYTKTVIKHNKSTQCLIMPSLTDNTYPKSKNVSTQSIAKSRTCTSTQCHIKPSTVDIGIQCSKTLVSVKINTNFPGDKAMRNAFTQVNLLRNNPPAELQACADSSNSSLTPIYVHLPNCLNEVFGIVQHDYPSLYSIVLPNRLEVIRKDIVDIPCIGEVPCKLIVDADGKASLVTALRTVKSTFDVSSIDTLKEHLFMLSDAGRHVFCPGIDNSYLDIAQKMELVEKLKWPCERIQSKKCLIWFMANSNMSNVKLQSGLSRCVNCSQLQRYLKQKKLNPLTEEQKRKRTAANSKCPMRCLSPDSLKKRKVAITLKQNEQWQIGQLEVEEEESMLNDEEQEEMERIVAAISQESDLEKLILSIEDANTRSASKAVWERDKLAHIQGLKTLVMDQKRNTMEIYQRGPATYHRLQDCKLLKLPSVRHLKRVKNRPKVKRTTSNEQLPQESDCETDDPGEEITYLECFMDVDDE